MVDINIWSLIVASLAVFIFSAMYYSTFSNQYSELLGDRADRLEEGMSIWKGLIELSRNFIVTLGVTVLIGLLKINIFNALLLGLSLWICFPVIILLGSVIHEKIPWKLAALHAGDWLVKLLIISAIISMWN